MIFQWMCKELVVEGIGRANKEAKTIVALNLIEHVENGDGVEDGVESTSKDKEPESPEPISPTVPGIRDTWPACLDLWTDDEKDWVK